MDHQFINRKQIPISVIITQILTILLFVSCNAQPAETGYRPNKIKVGAERMTEYVPNLIGKRIALLANHSSLVGSTHLVDTLFAQNIEIVKVLAPEHGFRGDRSNGAFIEDSKDQKTGIPIISIYGENKYLPSSLLEDVDVLIFDIQDVGVRFFTYISAMHYAMIACAESNTKFLVLDRPNPNGMYIDGPVLDIALQSYVGMHTIPVVHGLTVGELANMINGEGWLGKDLQCDLTVITVDNYDHSQGYSLPVKPSPNLPNDNAITLYPSLALFEGTAISVGRGTYEAFLQIGHPSFTDLPHQFTPVSIEGMSKYPPLEDELCYGYSFVDKEVQAEFSLKYLFEFYNRFEDKEGFFKDYFNTLMGNREVMKQIKAGWSEDEIKAEWQPDLEAYKAMRKKYLLYPDFD